MSKPLNAALISCLMVAAAPAAEYRAASAADINRLTAELKPGDSILMADGEWKDQAILFKGSGSGDNPITLRAATPGKVLLNGNSALIIDGQYLVVSGILLKDGTNPKDGIALKGTHCRLTDSAVVDGTHKFFVHLFGSDNRMDHCYLAGKTSESPTLQVEAEGQPNHHRIDHNHFGPRPPLGRNGGETMRVGYSGQSMNSSATLVELNLFDRCDGELEIISSKSCDNVYRFNTFLDCAGMLTLRHGNRCLVDSNFFFGHHKRGSGGIRVIGEEHIIVNNYIDGVSQGAFWITSGVPNSALNQYFQAKKCVIAFNTVVDSAGAYVDLSAGLGTSGRTLKPQDITIANNLFALPPKGTLFKGTEGDGWKWLGNLAQLEDHATTTEHPGLRFTELKLKRASDDLLRPAADSPAHGLAEGDFPNVKVDIDGQLRAQKSDVGCDQISEAPITNRPLTAKDVGPAWLEQR